MRLLLCLVMLVAMTPCFAITPGTPYKFLLDNQSDYTIKVVHIAKDPEGKNNDSSYCVEYSALPTIPPGKQAVVELQERLGCQHITMRDEKKFAIFTVVAVDKSKKETEIGTLFFGFKGYLRDGIHKNAPGGEDGYSPIITESPDALVNMKRTAVSFETATVTFSDNNAHH